MLERLSNWITSTIVLFQAFVGVVPQQAQAITEEERDIPLVFLCPLQ
ncbi:MAG: hypothetical protein AAGE84_02330 [Cyanobacteria bacterium P01_G01_bin.39]